MALAPIATKAPAAPPADVSGETQLEYLVRQTRACVLRPHCFFVSWQGVLTLAYRGFPAPLAELKQHISDGYPALPKESSGSRWPKTSLAALKEGRRLTPQQLERLNAVCRAQSGIFMAPNAARTQAVLVGSLSVVVYECRCLERVVSRRVLPLALPADLSDAPSEEFERVQSVVAEADEECYWFAASRDGNRERHYRDPAPGVTLVHELAVFSRAAQLQQQQQLQQPGSARSQQGNGATPMAAAAAVAAHAAAGPTPAAVAAANGSGGGAAPPTRTDSMASLASSSGGDGAGGAGGSPSPWSSALPGILARFRAAVEADDQLRGLYAWFEPESLHVTVRAVIL